MFLPVVVETETSITESVEGLFTSRTSFEGAFFLEWRGDSDDLTTPEPVTFLMLDGASSSESLSTMTSRGIFAARDPRSPINTHRVRERYVGGKRR